MFNIKKNKKPTISIISFIVIVSVGVLGWRRVGGSILFSGFFTRMGQSKDLCQFWCIAFKAAGDSVVSQSEFELLQIALV